MEPMKRCPQCGKNVPADRAYCMSCGVTLGVKCPECHAVSPVGSKMCTACGHSFVQKKTRSGGVSRATLAKCAPFLLLGLPILLLIFALVAAGQPTLFVSRATDGANEFIHRITGYELIGHFFSGEPSSVATLLGLSGLRDTRAGAEALLYVAGAGWICLLAGLSLSICLVACNLKRCGKATGRRLFWPFLTAMLGAVGLFVAGRVLTALVVDARPTDPTSTALIEWDTAAGFPLSVLILSALLLAVHTLLYATVLRRKSAQGEISLSRIFYIPFAALGRGLRKLTRAIGRRRKGRKGRAVRQENDEPTFTATHRFSTYMILFGVSLIFTQALLSKVSNIFFWFIFLLPAVMLVYVFLASRSLLVDMRSETVTTEKNTPHTYDFSIENRSVLAIPFLEAKINIPQSNSVRCTERLVRLSMAPLTGYTMKNTVTFRFRGTYDIGVKCFYVYDFFRLFRVKVDVDEASMTTVYVMPRRLSPDDALAQAIADSTVRTVRAPLVVDKLEVSDIRDYRSGDPLKSIHWKLSSKSETFVVKDYNTGTANQTVVYCDLAPHFPDESPYAPDEDTDTAPNGRKADRKPTPAPVTSPRPAKTPTGTADRAHPAEKPTVTPSRLSPESGNTHAISDDELNARLRSRAAAARILTAKAEADRALLADKGKADRDAAAATRKAFVDVHELAEPVYYEDINEYLADGVVELTIATVLSELREGHEVLLVWFDRRADSGICAYTLRGFDDFESIYHLFATAPLCDLSRPGSTVADYDVTNLTAMASDLQAAKQLFVVPTLDNDLLESLTALPAAADAGNAGSTEVVLYSPAERFKYPAERAGYIEGCREYLAAHGMTLTAGAFRAPTPDTQKTAEGGASHEE